MMQISSVVLKQRRQVPWTPMLSNNHIPSKTYWNLAVNRALQKIRSNSALIKVLFNYLFSVCQAWFQYCDSPPFHLPLSTSLVNESSCFGNSGGTRA